MIRLPGTCAGCGAKVELRLEGEVVIREKIGGFHDHRGQILQRSRTLPTAWCVPGTDGREEHRCGRG